MSAQPPRQLDAIDGRSDLARPGESTGPRDMSAMLAFEAFAPVYDAFTAHHDYELWLGNLLPKLEAHGLQGRRLLDVGCGTGKSFIPMLKRGWDVTACDISPLMLEKARSKVGRAANLSVADVRDLPLFGQFDLVWCLDDALNYLLSVEEFEDALASMARNLAPTGLITFDLNTLSSYRHFFAEEDILERDGKRLVWQGRTDPNAGPGCASEAILAVEPLEPAAGPAIPPVVHRGRHFPEDQVVSSLATAGLRCLAVFGHGYDAVFQQPLDEDTHKKAVYIACPDARA
jgi:SAM-dependent methyltransferase